MRREYLRILQTPAVIEAQEDNYGRSRPVPERGAGELQGLGLSEWAFIAERDSFYMASLSESGWPYLQHRGGTPGFLRAVGPSRIAFLDYEGNRQMISVGNVAEDDRVSLFLMDYKMRERLKLLCRARLVTKGVESDVWAQFPEEEASRATRMFLLEIVAFDWNCPKYIMQRFTRKEVMEITDSLEQRIQDLESELRTWRERGRAE